MDSNSPKTSRLSWLLRRGSSAEEPPASLGMVSRLECVRCGRMHMVRRSALWCSDCGMEGILDVQYDYPSIGKILTPERLTQATLRNQWRYVSLMPLRGMKRVPPLEIGWTPLYDAKPLAQAVGIDQLWLKDESKNPTGSIEDRATAVAVARALEDNHSMLTCGATGNAALSSAALSAAAGLQTTLFVSRDGSDAAVAHMLLCGADVYVVEGGYEDAIQLSLRCAEEYGWYNRNRAVNPFLVEGLKTVAFEVAEQMRWTVPDCVVSPVAEGSTIAAVWKGYKEMKELGWIARLPRMIGVQAENAAPLYTAWKENKDPVAVRPSTVAESLAVGAPRDWRRALAAVRDSNGMMVTVSDREILQAMHLLGEKSGIIAEPGSAATLAGLGSLFRSRELAHTGSALLLITGGGLRYADAAVQATGGARTVPPGFDDVRAILQRSLGRRP